MAKAKMKKAAKTDRFEKREDKAIKSLENTQKAEKKAERKGK